MAIIMHAGVQYGGNHNIYHGTADPDIDADSLPSGEDGDLYVQMSDSTIQEMYLDVFYPVGSCFIYSGSTMPTTIANIGEWTIAKAETDSPLSGLCIWKRVK